MCFLIDATRASRARWSLISPRPIIIIREESANVGISVDLAGK
jgi:hypothetical protein